MVSDSNMRPTPSVASQEALGLRCRSKTPAHDLASWTQYPISGELTSSFHPKNLSDFRSIPSAARTAARRGISWTDDLRRPPLWPAVDYRSHGSATEPTQPHSVAIAF